MKKLLGAVSIAVLVASSTVSVANDKEFRKQIRQQLDFASELWEEQGYEYIDDLRDKLAEDDHDTLSVELDRKTNYVLVGVCDTDCDDLDITVYDDDGDEVVTDDQSDDVPIVQFRAPYSGEYEIKVTMYDCGANVCYYGVALYGE